MSGQDDIAAAIENANVLAFPGHAPGGGRESESQNETGAEKAKQRSRARTGGGSAPPGGDDPPVDDGGGPNGVEDINRHYALVLLGSRAVVMRESAEGPIEDRVKVMTLDAFKAYFNNRTVRKVSRVKNDDGEWTEKVTYVKIAPLWLGSPLRRTYDGVEFFPDAENAPGTPNYFNLWRGFAIAPDPAPAPERARKYNVFRDHLLTNICAGDPALFDWMFAWLAHIVQRPRQRIGTAVVLRGRMGVGKTILGQIMGSLFPSHYFLVDDPRYLVGQFNAHMASCLLLQVDEGFWAGDKAAEGRLKGLVTADKQMIEAKGVDPIRLDNYVRLMFSSNESWVVPAGMDERRFAVFDVADHAKENHNYFAELFREMAEGGYAALLADLLAVDLDAESAPNVRRIPKTEALLEQKIRSLDPLPQWLYGRLVDGAQTHRKSKWDDLVAIRTVYNDFLRWAEKTVGGKRKPSDVEFGIAIKKLLPELRETRRTVEVEEIGDDGRPQTAFKRVRCYEFPSLDECRETFAAAFGQTLSWGPPLEEGERGDSAKNSEDHALS